VLLPGQARAARRTDSTASRAREVDALASLVELVAERAVELVLERLESAMADRSPYLNVEEAADYLRCDRQRIYDLFSSRRLTKHKDGSRVLVLRSECDELVAPALPPAAVSRMTARNAA
jgi:excisionase family DNA binding protein